MRASAWPVYYGWFVLAASAVAELLAQGASSYASGLFVLPLQAEFHISRAAANSSVIVLFLGAALVSPVVGRALDRFSIRLVVPLGALVFGAAFALIALSHSLLIMALILFLPAALGLMAIGPLTTSTLAARWFWKRRGLAMGLAAIATSGGGLVVVPLLSRAIRDHGWRAALIGEAAIITLLVILLSLVLRDTPSAVGLGSHPENQGRLARPPEERLSWRIILASSAFWRPSLALATVSGLSQAVVVTLVPYGVGLGISATSAALFISAFALAGVVTKLAAGIMADRMNPGTLITGALLAMIAAQLLFWLAPGYGGVLAAAILAGIALGAALPTAASMIATGFGASHFGAAMGWSYTLMLVFSIVATIFIGIVYDRTHGYGAGFIAFLVFCVLVLLVTLVLPRPRVVPA